MIRLQKEREARGLTRNALARAAHLGYGRVGQIELGRMRPPLDSVELQRLARALALPLPAAGTLLDEMDQSHMEEGIATWLQGLRGPNPTLNLEEVAEMTGYCYMTVWRAAKSGRLPARHNGRGGRYAVRVNDARKWGGLV
jgi:hypothetical protein